MRQTTRFKNPDDLLETEDELDELGDDMDMALGPENDSDGSISDIEIELPDDEDADFEPEEEEDDVYVQSSSDYDMTDTDTDDDDEVDDKDLEHTNHATRQTAAKESTHTESDAAGSSVAHLNEEDEDDETVRAIIAAIKKPRSAPPEIKLDDFITDICFHPKHDIVALATIAGDVYLYEYSNEKNTLLRCIEVHAKACRDVEFTQDGQDLITCSKDKSIMITDMFTEKLKKFYESAHDDAINTLYVLDQNNFATGDDVGTVKLWDLRTKEPIFALKESEDYITQIMSNDAKKLLIYTSGDGYLTTINIGARKLYVQSEPYEEEFNCMGIYRGDSKLVVGTSKGRLYTYNWGQFGYHCDMFPGIKTPISKMIPITDRIGCVAGEEGVIRACHIAPFRNLGIVGQHAMPIECMDINTTGELLATSSHSNDLRFWNVKYFEDFGDIKYNEKHNPAKEKRHNLPSSKFTNNADFFADLAKPASDE